MKGLLLVTLLGLVACKADYRGTFVASEDLDVVKGSRLVTILAGEYEASAKLKRKSVKLQLDNGEETLKLKLKSSALAPSSEGRIQASASQLGQAFGAKGSLTETVALSELKEDKERCRISIGTCGGPYGRVNAYGSTYMGTTFYPHNGYVCGVPGKRVVRFKLKTTTKKLNLGLVQDEAVVATLKAKNVEEERVYEYVGPCRI